MGEYHMSERFDWERSSWYVPGDWSLPRWWTNGPPARDGRATFEEHKAFYSSRFVREILGHDGGITTLPRSN